MKSQMTHKSSGKRAIISNGVRGRIRDSLINTVGSDQLETFICCLPGRKRIALQMAVDGYSFSAIATKLNVSRQMARLLLHGVVRDITYRFSRDFDNPETPIDNIMMPTRCYNALKRLDIHTVKDITMYSERQLLKSYGFGVACLGTIKAVLSQFGLSLK